MENAKRCKGCGEEHARIEGLYCESCLTQVIYEGMTRAQLRESFDMVACKLNWKNPIVKLIPGWPISEAMKREISAAVVFYAGCTPTFTRQGHQTLVKAVGYYEAVGA